jgi:hypothetical protein
MEAEHQRKLAEMDATAQLDGWYGALLSLARCFHSRMPLHPTHVRWKLLQACDQWHSYRVSTALIVAVVNFVETLKEPIQAQGGRDDGRMDGSDGYLGVNQACG